jgi:hypothetical protein
MQAHARGRGGSSFEPFNRIDRKLWSIDQLPVSVLSIYVQVAGAAPSLAEAPVPTPMVTPDHILRSVLSILFETCVPNQSPIPYVSKSILRGG